MKGPTLPAALVCRMASGILKQEAARLEKPGTRTKPEVETSRRGTARHLREQEGKIYQLGIRLHGKGRAEVDALAASFLLALCASHSGVMRDLEDRLEELGHLALNKVVDTRSKDLAKLFTLILEA